MPDRPTDEQLRDWLDPCGDSFPAYYQDGHYELLDAMFAELLELRQHRPADEQAPDDDRPPAEFVTVPFEVVLLVYLDGFGTGAATALAKVKPEASHLIIDDAAQALVNMLQIDPAAVEQLRDHIRGRLRGETDNRITEVPVWTPKDGE